MMGTVVPLGVLIVLGLVFICVGLMDDDGPTSTVGAVLVVLPTVVLWLSGAF